MGVSQELNITYFIFVGTVIIFMLATSIVVFFYIYQKKLHKQQQEMNAIVIRHQEQLLYANWEVIEEERKRLSKEFHDDIGSIFSTLSLTLGKLNDQDSHTNTHVEQVVKLSQQLIDTGIKNMHRILYDIVPPDIDIFGLSDTIIALCERVNSTPSLYISFNESGAPSILLNKHQELTLYRIIQELINNTIKHSGADRADIDLAWMPDGLSLDYHDNGKGFDTDKLSRSGLGLRNIESRAKMMGAEIVFKPLPQNGMNFNLTLQQLDAHE